MYTGCLQLTSGAQRKPSFHDDVWAEIDLALHENVLACPSKVTSHLSLQQVVDETISFKDYFANGLADAAADAIASLAAPKRRGAPEGQRRGAALLSHRHEVSCCRMALLASPPHHYRP